MRRSEAAMTRDVDGEAVILDIESGRYYGMDGVGAFIWNCLDHVQTRDQLLAAVVAEYDVDPATAQGDLNDLLTDLIDRGLVVE